MLEWLFFVGAGEERWTLSASCLRTAQRLGASRHRMPTPDSELSSWQFFDELVSEVERTRGMTGEDPRASIPREGVCGIWEAGGLYRQGLEQ